MASGGGKPGITARVTVAAIFSDAVVFQFKNKEDFDYFKGQTGNDYIAQFLPAPPEHPVSGSGEPGDG